MAERDERIEPGEESPLAAYRIELSAFEGPLDLLLHLIRKNEVDIYDIPIAEITRQYLQYLEVMKDLDLEIASEFLVMASHLVYIKSRMLLPVEAEDEEAEPEDPREELVRRLLEYQKYKKAAGVLGDQPALYQDVFPRSETDHPELPEEEFTEASLFQLMDAFQRVLSEAEKRVPVELSRESFTLEHAIELITERLSGKPSLEFHELFTRLDSRRKIITVFLGVLEMVKRGRLVAVQADQNAPLSLVFRGDKEPKGRSGTTAEGGGEGNGEKGS